jgi:hypothetical protein
MVRRRMGCEDLEVHQSISAFWLVVAVVVAVAGGFYRMNYNDGVVHDRFAPGKSFRVRNVGGARHECRSHLGTESLRRSTSPLSDLLSDLLSDHRDCPRLMRLGARFAFVT